MYVVGTALYIIATVLYLPSVAEAIGEYHSALFGSSGFILGSLTFCMACFLNGAHTGDAFSPNLVVPDVAKVKLAKILVLGTTNSTMFGAIL